MARSARLAAIGVVVTLVLTGCASTPVPQSVGPTTSASPGQSASPAPTAPPSVSTAAPLATTTQPLTGSGPTLLDECDPAGYVACDQQAATLTLPVADTSLELTYSSQWAAARQDRPDWTASGLGLGSWALNVVQRYDQADGVLISGDGSWRFVAGIPLPSGGMAIPSFDGSVAYIFDAAGRHVRTVDGHLGTTLLTLTYDSAGQLSTIDGTSGGQPAHLSVTRSGDGTPTALVGTDGASTTIQVDSNGQLVGVRSPAGASTTIAWAPGGFVTSETDPLGGVTRFAYDETGLLSSSTDADGVAQLWSNTATDSSIEVHETSTLGRVTTFRTESDGGVIKRTFIAPDGSTTTETTDSAGVISITYPDGSTLSLGAVPSATWGKSAPVLTPQVLTRPGGVLSRTETTQNLASTDGTPYDLAGSLTTTVNGQAWTQSFDPASRTTTLVDPAGRKSVNSYDANGRLVSATAPETAPVSFAYDAHGRETSQTVGTGASSQTTTYGYDAANGQIKITRPDGSVVLVAIDADGRTTTTTAPDGSTLLTGYDADGRLTEVQPPGGLEFALGSSPAGRPTAFLPPAVESDSSAQVTTYDGDGNPTSVSGLGDRSIQLAYDTVGRLVGWTFDMGTASATYSPVTQLPASATDPDGVTTTYGYDGAAVDKLGWSGPVTGSVSDQLDANGRPVAESVNGSPGITSTYDPSGLLTAVGGLAFTRDPGSGFVMSTVAGDVQTAERYDSTDQVIRLTTSVGGAVMDDVQYTRDALGRITSMIETAADGTTTTTDYAYDGSDRLASIKVNGATTQTDTYDAAGDRTASAGASGTTNATYDARDRLLTWGAETLAWNDDGTLASRTDASGKTAYKFDGLGNMRGIALPDGRSITYLVDADGRRVGREVGGQLMAGYLYDPSGRLVAETDGTGAVAMQFGYDDVGHLALVQRGSSTYRVITDSLGSPRFVIDAGNGAIVDAITYDAWGQILTETAPGTIPFGFAGGLVDPDTGLVHFGARDYDPTTGIWLAADPIGFAGGQANLYQYAGSDPVNIADPTGLTEVGDCLGAGGKIVATDVAYCDPGDLMINGHELPPSSSGASDGTSDTTSDTTPAAPPTSESGGSRTVTCTGYLCKFVASGCINGTCSIGPNGFTCKALLCVGPHGGLCVQCSVGDVHLRTGDGDHVDFQGAGEYIAVTSPDGSVEIQARQEPWTSTSSVSVNTAVAANVDGDRVGVYAREPSFLMVNGAALAAPDLEQRLPHGGLLERHGGTVIISWPDGSTLNITQNGTTLNYGFAPSAALGPTLHGLLGNADGNAENDLTGRDGTVLSLSDPDFKTKLYQQFGNSWRISQAESLFDYQPGESTATFTDLAFPPTTTTLATLDPDAKAKAQAVCIALGVTVEPWLDDCILDVGATRDDAFASSEAAIVASGAPPTAGAASPTDAGQVSLGQTVSGSIASTGEMDDYTFTATAGQIVYLQTLGTCPTPALSWTLLGPDNEPLGTADTCHDIGRVVLLTAGVDTVRIYSSGTATGSYSFTMLAVPAVPSTTISIGQAVTGNVASIGEEPEYTFATTAGQIVYLQTQGACPTPPLSWTLLGPDGAPLGDADTCHDIARVVLPTAGVYTIRIYSFGTATGSFGFTVLAVPAVPATTISVGQQVTGNVASIGQEPEYTFTGTAGQVVNVQTQGQCPTPPLSWTLLGPDGAPLGIADTCNDIGRVVLPAAGQYTIRIYSFGTATGPYAFTIQPGH